jgi:hypothetical protein
MAGPASHQSVEVYKYVSCCSIFSLCLKYLVISIYISMYVLFMYHELNSFNLFLFLCC